MNCQARAGGELARAGRATEADASALTLPIRIEWIAIPGTYWPVLSCTSVQTSWSGHLVRGVAQPG